MDLAFGKWNLIENSATTVGKDPFDADEEDRRDDEDDDQEQLERQERRDEEEDEDIYSDDMCGNQRSPFGTASCARSPSLPPDPASVPPESASAAWLLPARRSHHARKVY